jgi:hypothetical protein
MTYLFIVSVFLLFGKVIRTIFTNLLIDVIVLQEPADLFCYYLLGLRGKDVAGRLSDYLYRPQENRTYQRQVI